MTFEVYVHVFPNGKKYVGLTMLGVRNRWKDGKGYKSQFVRRAIDKYGWENIEHVVVFTTDEKWKAETVEKLLIRACRTNNKEYGYNIEVGGQFGALGIKRSPETIVRIKESKIGFRMTEEAKKKISKTLKGRVFTEQHRRRKSEAQMGEKNHRFGIRLTNEQRIELCKKAPKGKDHPSSVKIDQYDIKMNLIKTWDCMEDIRRELGVGHCMISDCCRGKQKTSRGFIWRYHNDCSN